MKVIQFAVWREDCGNHYFWRGRNADYQPNTWHGDQQYRYIYPCRVKPHDGKVVGWLCKNLSSRLKSPFA